MNKFKYHIYIAHSAADRRIALQLYQALSPEYQVFLDSESLLPGDAWDKELVKAQREALVTAVLISPETESAYYQQEEIASAIDLSRRPNYYHRVVPIYLHCPDTSNIPTDVPYGLRRLQGISMSRDDSVGEVAQKLQRLLMATAWTQGETQSRKKKKTPSKNILKRRSKCADDELIEAISTIRLACKARQISASLIYMDVDGLSLINKVFGGAVGDKVIQTIDGLFTDIFTGHFSVRRGEDEFLCCLKGKGVTEAIDLGDRLREMIKTYRWTSIAPDLHVTVSMGVVELNQDDEIVDGIIRAFYGAHEAKQFGGNAVMVGPSFLPKYVSRDLDDYGS